MGAQLLMLCTGYAAHLFIARALGPVEYGHYGKAMVGLFWIEMGLFGGLSIGLPRLIAAHRAAAPQLLKTCLLVTSAIGGTLTLLGFFVAPWIAAKLGAEGYAGTFRMAVLDVVPYGVVFAMLGVLDGASSFGRKTLVLIGYAVSKMAAIIGLVAAGFGSAGACAGNVVGSVCGAVVGIALVVAPLRVLRSDTAPVPAGLGRALLRSAIPQGAFTLGIQLLMGLDLLAMGVQGVASSAQGRYVAAQQLARAPYLLLTSQSTMVVPLVAGALRDGKLEAASEEELRRAGAHLQAELRIAIWLLGLAVALALPLGGPLLGVLFGEEYGGTGSLLVFLMTGLLCVGLYRALGLGSLAGGRVGVPLVVLAVAVVLDLALNFALVPSLGPLGAAVGTAAAGVFAAIGVLLYLRRSFRFGLPMGSLFRTLAAAIVVGGVAYALRAQPLAAAIAGGLLYLFLLYLLGERRVMSGPAS